MFHMHTNVPIYCSKIHMQKTVPFIKYMFNANIHLLCANKEYLGRTMFAMIIVYINKVLVISCLSTKPSVFHGLAFAYYTHWNSHCWSLFNRRGISFTSDFLIFTLDLFIGKIFFESCSPAKSLKINLRYVYVLVTWKTLASSLCINAIIHLFLSAIA